MKTNHPKSSVMIDAFREGCKPFTTMEEAEFFISEAAKSLSDTSKPEHERFNSAIRFLCGIGAIGDRLTLEGANEIYGRQGVMQKSAV